jgi:hypothetical protein
MMVDSKRVWGAAIGVYGATLPGVRGVNELSSAVQPPFIYAEI